MIQAFNGHQRTASSPRKLHIRFVQRSNQLQTPPDLSTADFPTRADLIRSDLTPSRRTIPPNPITPVKVRAHEGRPRAARANPAPEAPGSELRGAWQPASRRHQQRPTPTPEPWRPHPRKITHPDRRGMREQGEEGTPGESRKKLPALRHIRLFLTANLRYLLECLRVEAHPSARGGRKA